ncbi:hypothetical protein ATANTOWER_002282 [Ataeniobius toweri]|uniref:Uncharacterized protein n=1 Tax=Ataeniobius toweri TaxID=208326 RepID=A0ABU7BZE3_9TELE|nr:hypothetical protein [Ataeniobius toweri]
MFVYILGCLYDNICTIAIRTFTEPCCSKETRSPYIFLLENLDQNSLACTFPSWNQVSSMVVPAVPLSAHSPTPTMKLFARSLLPSGLTTHHLPVIDLFASHFSGNCKTEL